MILSLSRGVTAADGNATSLAALVDGVEVAEFNDLFFGMAASKSKGVSAVGGDWATRPSEGCDAGWFAKARLLLSLVCLLSLLEVRIPPRRPHSRSDVGPRVMEDYPILGKVLFSCVS